MSRPPFPDTARPRVPFVAGPFVAGGFTGHARRGARRRPRRFCLPCLPPPTQIARHARLHILLSGGKQNRHGCRSDGQPADGGPY